MVHRVDVLKEQELAFPDMCVNCGSTTPDAAMKIKGSSASRVPHDESIFKSWKVDVPCCNACKGSIRRHRLLSKVLYGIGFVVSLFLMLLVGMIWPDLYEGWTVYVVIIGSVALPIGVIQSIHAPPIDFTPSDDRLVFEFKNQGFATQFAELNASQVE